MNSLILVLNDRKLENMCYARFFLYLLVFIIIDYLSLLIILLRVIFSSTFRSLQRVQHIFLFGEIQLPSHKTIEVP